MSHRSSGARAGAWVAGGILLTMLWGCGPPLPAPVVSGVAAGPAPTAITVARGQTLSGIAADYHVPMRALAAANNLTPPYPIRAGAKLVLPAGAAAPATGPQLQAGPPPAPQAAPAPPAPAAIAELAPPSQPRPPPLRRATAPPQASSQPTSLLPRPRSPGPRPAPESPPAPEHTPPSPTANPAGSAPASAAPASAAPAPAAHAKPAEAPKTAMATPAPPPPPPVARHGGKFLWPVRGHVLEGFGAGPHGTHNDGLNIAAPRGAAVVAADSGVVAYAGNELRGYGNLVLIKHPNGWISAYAHCDLILVKKGEKVTKGQVIARVGATGNVSRPQLHFELRKGDKPVDPRDYLAPLPTAAGRRAGAG